MPDPREGNFQAAMEYVSNRSDIGIDHFDAYKDGTPEQRMALEIASGEDTDAPEHSYGRGNESGIGCSFLLAPATLPLAGILVVANWLHNRSERKKASSKVDSTVPSKATKKSVTPGYVDTSRVQTQPRDRGAESVQDVAQSLAGQGARQESQPIFSRVLRRRTALGFGAVAVGAGLVYGWEDAGPLIHNVETFLPTSKSENGSPGLTKDGSVCVYTNTGDAIAFSDLSSGLSTDIREDNPRVMEIPQWYQINDIGCDAPFSSSSQEYSVKDSQFQLLFKTTEEAR